VKDTPWPLDHVKGAVNNTWGIGAREKLGDRLYEAELHSELLELLVTQAKMPGVEPKTLGDILQQGHTQIIEEMNS
jgi:hypothetical protein